MTSPFAAAAQCLVRSIRGADALYQRPGEVQQTLRIVLSRPEEPAFAGLSSRVTAGAVAMAARVDLPDRPERGDLLSVGGQDYVVETAESDPLQATWRITLVDG